MMAEQRERDIDREPAYPPGTVFSRAKCKECGLSRPVAEGDDACGLCKFSAATVRQRSPRRNRPKNAEPVALAALASIRRERGLSMKELAHRAELNVKTVVEHERGEINEPSLYTALKLARALDVPVEALVEGA